jgi:hypothetical protein
MSVLRINDTKWLIGVEMAHLLQRETYNLYRSMKVKYIAVQRATPDQVDFLIKTNVVKPGTRSVTFVPLEPAIPYINEELKKIGSRKKKNNNSNEVNPNTKIINANNSTSNPLERLNTPVPTSTPTRMPAIGSPQSAFDLLCTTAEVELTTPSKQLLATTAKGYPLLQHYQQQYQLQQQLQLQQQFQQLQNTSMMGSPFPWSQLYQSSQLAPPMPQTTSLSSQHDALSTRLAIANLLNETNVLPGLGNLPFFPSLPQISPNYSNMDAVSPSSSSASSSSSPSSSHKSLTELYSALSGNNNRLLSNVNVS